ncbi:myocyte-specific enhancer factor 2B isoform X1 [Malaclemys terrapin pileata]|uniref:myocyte-specific enhancer factor 2B isoform X1 n=1 Tax=Malaclemys terrapin pileata TaxID=2991368 RepID=UPI0023A8541D|nr:myocyte-specific enhancer factor 2B isoform X1 [Malaclemys terrapin pileata]XP_053869807.1 myocyte-specific enhancer factor 2B isoform X1 [Malaclemys terrapin pileata]
MGRKKIQISRILDQRNRQVTFTKRKFGLMKKAYELSVLCDCEIALIIFNSTNRLFQYASTDMDKVLLKYTEYSEPHESRTNSDILETLKRKGLGLESQELELDEGLDPTEKIRKLNEGVDLTVARPRLYSSAPPPSHEAAYAGTPPSGSDGGLSSANGSPQHQSRLPVFKSPIPKHGQPSGRSPGPLPPGLGYPLFSHGNLNRALATKTPPPLYLGTDGRRVDVHSSLSSARSNLTSAQRSLYPGLQTVSPGLPAGNGSLPAHGLGGFPFLSSSQAEYGPGEASTHPGYLQPNAIASWQHHRDMAASAHLPLGAGGRMLPTEEAAPAPSSSPQHQAISIKSERVSPVVSCSSATPQHSLSGLSSLGDVPRGPGDPPQRDEYAKAYHYPLVLSRPLAEEQQGGVPMRRPQVMDVWQR